MIPPIDSSHEMFGNLIDRGTADRLLAGAIPRDDVPPGYADVAQLVDALHSPADRSELVDERVAVAAAVRSLRDQVPAPVDTRRWRMRMHHRAKLGAIVVVGTLLGTAGMAAANVLPGAAQDGVSNALSHVGITVPHSSAEPSSDHPAATGKDVSTIATTTDASGVAKGAEVSTAASGGMSQAGQHGGGAPDPSDPAADPGGSAVVTTPNPGGTGTADGASGGADATGSSTANDASGGHAGAGSSNASAAPSPVGGP